MADLEHVGAEYVRTVHASPFGIIVGDRVVELLDLDPEALAQIARLVGVPWVALIETPTADLGAAMALIGAAEAVADVEASRPYTVADVLARFVRVRRNGAEAVE